MKPHVYFVRAGVEGPIKIGWTRYQVEDRMARLQRFSPEPLHLIGARPGSVADEQHLHRFFERQALGGEWFTPSDDLLLVATGKAWPDLPALELKPNASVDPNDVDMTPRDWRTRAEIERHYQAGLSELAIAELLRWSHKAVQREMERMARLGYFRGVRLLAGPMPIEARTNRGAGR